MNFIAICNSSEGVPPISARGVRRTLVSRLPPDWESVGLGQR